MITGAHLKRLLLSAIISLGLIPINEAYCDIKDKISFYEAKYKLPHNLLLAMALTESRLNPWAINIDGIPVFPASKSDALSILKSVASGNLYGIYLQNGSLRKSGFYRSKDEAAHNLLKYTNLKWKAIKNKGQSIRKLNPINSDVCLLQINYKYHGDTGFDSVNDMFDIDKCIKYSAKYLSTLINRHGITKGIGCYNTCGTKLKSVQTRNKYIAKVLRNWKQ